MDKLVFGMAVLVSQLRTIVVHNSPLHHYVLSLIVLVLLILLILDVFLKNAVPILEYIHLIIAKIG